MATASRHPALLRDSEEIVDYITGGKATFTIKNRNTGNRATYRVEAREDGGFDVLAFTGSDNSLKSSYTLMGRMDDEGFFTPRTGADLVNDLEKAVMAAPQGHWVDNKPDFRAKVRALLLAGRTLSKNMAYRFNGACSKYGVAGYISDRIKLTILPWTWDRLVNKGLDLPDVVEIWHEGGCKCCGKKLTVPASIELGMGPDCAESHGKLDDWNALNRKLGSDLDAYLAASGRVVADEGAES